ncbi:MAG: UDP-N-acetylglucosamine 1-carboxyvinyltransferase, partial [Firmicutes bacterium]|nr:UDP-N-acetylglucosamine 1-carboxyvinyltransferase [Bacillota bacterium]
MEKYIIEGGNRLNGEVEISGAKNAVVAIIPATILAKDRCVIENVPNISDVTILFRILRDLGAKVNYLTKNSVEIDTSHISEPVVPYESSRHLRASYYFLGAFLGRFSEAHVSPPGGCNFGVRPIDQHIKGFEALGAEITTDYGFIHATSPQLYGSHIYLDVVSVGATINIMLAAVKAKGLTVIENCAKEPHIVDL